MSDEQVRERLLRLGECMQYVQLMARAISSLSLSSREAICQTFNALIGSFFDCRHHAILLIEPDSGWLRIAAADGFADAPLRVDDAAQSFLSWAMQEPGAVMVPSDIVAARWQSPHPHLAGGLASAVIQQGERACGLLVVANKRVGADFDEEELTFLACAAGLVSMAVVNATMVEELEIQRLLAEDRAEQAAEQAEAKQRALGELDQKLAIIEQQRAAILELSTPILQLWDDVVALPIIGVIDAQRGEQIMERLLDEVSRRRARFVILDVTGVEMVDTRTADHLLRIVRSAQLLGATCVMTGIQPAVAQTLVTLGAELGSLITKATIGEGLADCIRRSRARSRRETKL